MDGIPTVPEIDLNDSALSSLIDALEGASRPSRTTVTRERGNGVGRLAALHEDRAAARPTPAPVAAAEPQGDGKNVDLEIEDDVIRELAYSLRPTGR